MDSPRMLFNKGTIIRQLFRMDDHNKNLVAGDSGYVQVKTQLHFSSLLTS